MWCTKQLNHGNINLIIGGCTMRKNETELKRYSAKLVKLVAKRNETMSKFMRTGQDRYYRKIHKLNQEIELLDRVVTDLVLISINMRA